MKIILLLTLSLLFLTSQLVKSQNVKDTIQIKRSTFGLIYQQNNKNLSIKSLTNMLVSTPESYSELKIARTNNICASILGGTAGYLIGYNLASSRNRNVTWTPFIISFGLIGLMVPFEIGRAKHIKQAVLNYNNGVLKTSKNKAVYKIIFSNNGTGVKICF